MNTILLIRHAQASAHAAHYDQLSELGYRQADLLSQALAEITPSAVFYGPRKRQLQTLERCMRPRWPTPERWEALDEYPALEMLKHCLDQIAALAPHISEDIKQVREHSGSAGAAYLPVLKEGARLWMSGALQHPELEPYEAYQQRLKEICQRVGRRASAPILCFSSAGLISTLLSEILGGHAERSLGTAWSLYNTSISELLFDDGLSVSAVNRIGHIPLEMRSFI